MRRRRRFSNSCATSPLGVAIAFVYAGDIWVADRNGANPRQLTSDGPDGSNPVFSPDGSMIAFSANHNENKDVYVVSVNGGQRSG